jgi:hypothetical protein
LRSKWKAAWSTGCTVPYSQQQLLVYNMKAIQNWITNPSTRESRIQLVYFDLSKDGIRPGFLSMQEDAWLLVRKITSTWKPHCYA